MPAQSIPAKIAASASVTRFRGQPHELRALLPDDVARRVSYVSRPAGWNMLYTYTLHEDRTLAQKRIARSDNATRLLVAD